MASSIETIAEKIRQLEEDLEDEINLRRQRFQFHLEKKRVRFESEIARQHQQSRIGLWHYVRSAKFLVLLTAPVIYAVVIPLALLDFFVSLYQAVCFPVYGIAKVRRDDYMAFDHRHLAYLNFMEKVNCLYCSYANGLIAYVREIAARTEQYWCPIKHARRIKGIHPRYPDFADYGDAEAYRQRLATLRDRLVQEKLAENSARIT